MLCLRGVYGSSHKINFGKYYADLPEECTLPELIRLRNREPVAFLEQYVFKTYAQHPQAVGFKYFYTHSRHLKDKNALVDYFANTQHLKFIHLKRTNLLASLFSYKRALAQNQWILADPTYKTALSPEECMAYFESTLAHQRYFDQLLGPRSLQIEFEILIQNTAKTLTNIQFHLGLSQQPLQATTARNHPIKLAKQITNYHELRQHFQHSEYERYFDE